VPLNTELYMLPEIFYGSIPLSINFYWLPVPINFTNPGYLLGGLASATIEDLAFGILSSRGPSKGGRRVCIELA
jgi:hypothetical protein